jgi:hypothetical protein
VLVGGGVSSLLVSERREGRNGAPVCTSVHTNPAGRRPRLPAALSLPAPADGTNGALAALLQLAAAVPVRPWDPCGSTPALPMTEPTPAQLAAAAVAVLLLYGRPRLYRPRHRQRRIRPGVVPGVVRVRA